MEIYVGWSAANTEEVERMLEEYRSDLRENSALDAKFEDGSEKVTVDGGFVGYTGPGGRLLGLLEGREDLDVKREQEDVVQHPYGVTD